MICLILLLHIYFSCPVKWHTDGRTFLGPKTTIASLSLGHKASFEMRRMNNVWPCAKDPNGGIDLNVKPMTFNCAGGDLLVMRGDTQKHWHHRVPKETYREPRVNINFRYILPNRIDSERGQQTYYKYMVYGDETDPKAFMFTDILSLHGKKNRKLKSLQSMWNKAAKNDIAVAQVDKVDSGDMESNSAVSMTFASFVVAEKKDSHGDRHATQWQKRDGMEGQQHNEQVKSSFSVRTQTIVEKPWICDNCTFVNASSCCFTCAMCGVQYAEVPNLKSQEKNWACCHCTFINDHCRSICGVCMRGRKAQTLPGAQASTHQNSITGEVFAFLMSASASDNKKCPQLGASAKHEDDKPLGGEQAQTALSSSRSLKKQRLDHYFKKVEE